MADDASIDVTFRLPDGSTQVVDARVGTSVMQAAVESGVPGIIGECGGQAMCATCHVYVDQPAMDALPDIGEDEDEMLDSTDSPRTERSRLGCQLTVGPTDRPFVFDVPDAYL